MCACSQTLAKEKDEVLARARRSAGAAMELDEEPAQDVPMTEAALEPPTLPSPRKGSDLQIAAHAVYGKIPCYILLRRLTLRTSDATTETRSCFQRPLLRSRNGSDASRALTVLRTLLLRRVHCVHGPQVCLRCNATADNRIHLKGGRRKRLGGRKTRVSTYLRARYRGPAQILRRAGAARSTRRPKCTMHKQHTGNVGPRSGVDHGSGGDDGVRHVATIPGQALCRDDERASRPAPVHESRTTTRQTFLEFVAALKEKVLSCKFGATYDNRVRDQIIHGVANAQVRTKLLSYGEALTLQKAEVGRDLEALNKANAAFGENERLLGSLAGDGGSVQRVARGFAAAAQNGGSAASAAPHATQHGGGFLPNADCRVQDGYAGSSARLQDGVREQEGQPASKPHIGPCFRCGKLGHLANSRNCPAKNKTCQFCRIKGHFAAVCRKRQASVQKVSYRRPRRCLRHCHSAIRPSCAD
ncbi:hypothetical protein HPB49_021092 [Dermacentor silvarum]|uniref:Uncharacterized protein n=1 Tax=Dermacentor silvarum TaxID=543639 RepID=A0ACB8D895_DERSI|nr:hypothetical protein HPB49_021092 [Dermacentor silvarum]